MKLSFTNLSHTYLAKQPRPALAGVSLEVPESQFCAVLGPSGCGKSTLLRLAAGLLQPTAGQVRVDGRLPAEAAAQRRTAWLAQSPALLPWLTAHKNVALGARFACPGGAGLAPAVALDRVGLADSGDEFPFQLSGGMQQRLALARLLCQGAELWLMDEPFASLDALTREHLSADLLQLWQPLRTTVLWVTHQIHEALRLADRAVVLSPRPGHVVLDLPIPQPRPRREADPLFQEQLGRLRAALGLEAEPAR